MCKPYIESATTLSVVYLLGVRVCRFLTVGLALFAAVATCKLKSFACC